MSDYMEQPTPEDKKFKHPLVVILLIILGIIVILAFHEVFSLLFMVGVTIAIVLFVKRANDKQRIQDEFKKNNFEAVLQSIFPGSQYFPKGEILMLMGFVIAISLEWIETDITARMD